MTVNELKNAIRWANIRITEAYERINKKRSRVRQADRNLFNRKLELLQSEYGTGRFQSLKLGFRGKRKRQLEQQLSEFESFADFAETTIKNRYKRKDTATRAAYKEFMSRYGGDDLSYKDYKDMVTIFGAIGDKIRNQFGSDNLATLYQYADAEQKSNFIKIMTDVLHDSKGKGWTTEQLYDEMFYRLENEQELKATRKWRRSRGHRK